MPPPLWMLMNYSMAMTGSCVKVEKHSTLPFWPSKGLLTCRLTRRETAAAPAPMSGPPPGGSGGLWRCDRGAWAMCGRRRRWSVTVGGIRVLGGTVDMSSEPSTPPSATNTSDLGSTLTGCLLTLVSQPQVTLPWRPRCDREQQGQHHRERGQAWRTESQRRRS